MWWDQQLPLLQVSARVNPPEADWRPAADAVRREATADVAAPDDMAELNELLYTRDELMNRWPFHILASIFSISSISSEIVCTYSVRNILQTVHLQVSFALCRILEEEDNLIAAHRWQIEETMAIVRQEMNLLGQVRHGSSACIESNHAETSPLAALHYL